ncbi:MULTISPECIES: beta-ketoacyl synthase N-terminal-like domain-containing protein [unclassified Undibacterium]|nr:MULTISPECIES: beta-ketoacyl synthase N-terminal-like domain-containing protein [unclassified Undibacterium]MEB0138388.1 beta-ketoacyl synthase N-terminal-like domain-containing protein [Undibacterium sp. CCC2.1]MEB0171263.1 beta-ketoacyl synthase N-terminal-like domain-containing protein [Undibacterium sp. CCC1.1]MEB0176615.1 beta-ketoacyl synthase N-terminal-like domain-containing protein [Undibacterium sp. CCC3.4]WPX43632.1 beta-ketoacyl synthase N-terminal-like domain-containing protein [
MRAVMRLGVASAATNSTGAQVGPPASAALSDLSAQRSVSVGPYLSFPFEQRLERRFFELSVAWTERIAIIDAPEHGATGFLTYGALRHRVMVLAHHLQQLGVQPGQVIGVHMERSSDLIVSILAIWMVGAVYLPLDRAFPQAYLASLCAIARPSAFLIAQGNADAIGGAGFPQLSLQALDFGWPVADADTCGSGFGSYASDAPALIMFTSGSTGQPKGVRHSQLQLINRFHWMWHDYPFQSGDVIAQRSPMNVMPSMWELLGGVLSGITTVIAPDHMVREPAALFAWLAQNEVSHLTLTPQLIKLLLYLKQNGARHPERLRRVINGGPLSAALQQRFCQEFPGTTLLHDFGCTETNTYLHEAIGGVEQQRALGPGGYLPIANTSIHILDAAGRAVAPGVEGEVYIAGPCVAIDYLHQPQLSVERFISGGLADSPVSGRLFRTGEMAHMLPHGTIRMTGRYDHQAKVNGLRVELEHVELVLGDHPGVGEVAVVAHALSDLHTRLVAFWVARPGMPADDGPLRDFLAQRLPAHMVPGIYTALLALPRRPNGKIDRVSLQQQLRGAVSVKSARTHGETEQILIAVVAELLGVDADLIDTRREFNSLGLDSAMLMSFATSAALLTGLDVPVAICFDHPSIALLTRHLDSGAGAAANPLAAMAATPAPAMDAAPVQDGIAIIGISLRVPGARDLASFWHNLELGIESVGPIPAERWDGDAYYDADMATPGRSNSKWGGFLSDIDQFEPLFFNLSPKEAASMDPQQRLCLMESWRALEDAGYAPDGISHQQVGVFIGAREPDYAGLGVRQGQLSSAATLLGSDMSLIAARISYFLNLNGPSMVVDTACSSSMTALHLACQSLRSGEAELALAGGICLTLDPEFFVASSKLGIFSPSGHCRAFDAAADGFVHGEGLAFVVLKPLQSALHDGDHVYAVIRGTALNQDGRSNGITAPNGLAQTRLQHGLYERLGINPASIGYVEAHGTGTALGDVVEVQALTRTFQEATSNTQFCALGSVKPNIGHLTTASGILGVIKTALCLHYGKLVPSINFDQPNPKIDFPLTPFYVNTSTCAWPTPVGGVRRAAVNSFGIGGTNGHCVLEQLSASWPLATERREWYLVPITARTPAAVRERLSDLLAWLQRNGTEQSAHALAYTLSCGRSRFESGYLLAFQDLTTLGTVIDTVLAGQNSANAWAMSGRRNPDRVLVDEAARLWDELVGGASRSQLGQLADMVVQGYWPQWQQWFAPSERRRIALPTYPFQTERCWLAAVPSAAFVPPAVPVAMPTPTPTPTVPAIPTAPAIVIQDAVRLASIQTEVLAILADELGLLAFDIDPHAPLSNYGMESVKAINLRFRLEERLSVDLSIQQIVSADTAQRLARLALEAGATPSQGTVPVPDDDLSQASDEQLIALFKQFATNPEHS